jgi:serine/threonine protein kinase
MLVITDIFTFQQNLLLTREGPGAEIKIIDFGLSKMLPDVGGSDTQSFLGTRGYLAPEMLKRQAYSASVDVWALGVIAFILLCGCLPFDDDSARITSEEAARAKFQLRFPQWASNISPEAKSFLGELLNSDAKSRITSAQALEHPWLEVLSDDPASPGASPSNKKTLLASPKHIRNVPRTPTRMATGAPPLRVPAGIEEERLGAGARNSGSDGRGIGGELSNAPARTRGGSF